MTSLLARLRHAVASGLAPLSRKPEPTMDGHAVAAHPWEGSYPPGLDWKLELRPRSLVAMFDDAVAAYADNPCLEFLGKSYTYRETADLVAKTARSLQDLGLDKGDRVGLFLPNCPYYVICYHAILRAGCIAVNFNPLYSEREIAHQIVDAGCRVLVTLNLKSLYPKVARQLDETTLERIIVCSMSGALPFPGKALFAVLKRKEIAAIPNEAQHLRFERLIANADDDCTPVDIDPATDIATLQYTGGTTGVPKGAMLTHANLYANTVQTRVWATGIQPGRERILAVLPLFHVFGMTGVMNVGLYSGSQLILLPRFKLAEVLKTIHEQRPTVLMGVPTMYSAINGHKELHKFDLSSLAYCISGGAPLPLEVKTMFERLTGCTLVEGYGLTEASPVCSVNPFEGVNKPGSIGLPVPGTVIEIRSLDDPAKRMPIGEQGEICITGPQVMAGYWHHEEETAAVLTDGLLRTGDVGYIDEDGYVFHVDRIKDLIITAGFNVYPRVVEEAIMLHPAVEEVVACGVPNRHRGEIVKAYVKLREGETLTAYSLRTFLEDKLAAYALPRRVEFRAELPRTFIGKPSRKDLLAEELRHAGESSASPGNGKGAPDGAAMMDATPGDRAADERG